MRTKNDGNQADARIPTGNALDSLTAPTVEQGGTHTPTPWTAGPYGLNVFAMKGQMTICDLRGWGYLTGVGGLHLSDDDAARVQTANQQFIVTACNAHADIVAALKAAAQFLDPAVDRGPSINGWRNTSDMVCAALAKAEGR